MTESIFTPGDLLDDERAKMIYDHLQDEVEWTIEALLWNTRTDIEVMRDYVKDLYKFKLDDMDDTEIIRYRLDRVFKKMRYAAQQLTIYTKTAERLAEWAADIDDYVFDKTIAEVMSKMFVEE